MVLMLWMRFVLRICVQKKGKKRKATSTKSSLFIQSSTEQNHTHSLNLHTGLNFIYYLHLNSVNSIDNIAHWIRKTKSNYTNSEPRAFSRTFELSGFVNWQFENISSAKCHKMMLQQYTVHTIRVAERSKFKLNLCSQNQTYHYYRISRLAIIEVNIAKSWEKI